MDLTVQDNMIRKKTVKIDDLLILCFVAWPFFWNLWVSLKVTTNFSYFLPRVLLVVLTVLFCLKRRTFTKSSLFIWIPVFITFTISGFRGSLSTAFADIIVLLCGFIICLAEERRCVNSTLIMKCMFVIGFFVAVTVLVDAATGLFYTRLMPLYSPSAQSVMNRRNIRISTGGILPHTASAGCFICSGLAAYFFLQKTKKTNRTGWIMILIFIISIIILQKRGFLLDIILAVSFMWIFSWQFIKNERLKLRKQIMFAFTIIVLGVVAVLLYFYVPMVRFYTDSLLNRFTNDEGTLSGRTLLYSLALSFYRRNPLLGIGWGKFRGYTQGIFSQFSATTYEVHNVYLQLLCETGIIGLVTFLTAVGTTLFHSVKKYWSFINTDYTEDKFQAVRLGLFLQLFFLFYCLSGNPLYDYNFLITYFIGILLTL